jgi:hypothetical protein
MRVTQLRFPWYLSLPCLQHSASPYVLAKLPPNVPQACLLPHTSVSTESSVSSLHNGVIMALAASLPPNSRALPTAQQSWWGKCSSDHITPFLPPLTDTSCFPWVKNRALWTDMVPYTWNSSYSEAGDLEDLDFKVNPRQNVSETQPHFWHGGSYL